jgi:hypothetical protein
MEGDGWSHVAFAAASSCSTTSNEYGTLAPCHALPMPGFRPLGLPSAANSHPSLCSSILYQRCGSSRQRGLLPRLDYLVQPNSHRIDQLWLRHSEQGFSCPRPPENLKQNIHIDGLLERLVRCFHTMTCIPVIGRKDVDILQDFMSWINSLRMYDILSSLKSRSRGFIMTVLGSFSQNFGVAVRFVESLWSFP